MELGNSILEDIREAVGLGKGTVDFDTELIMYINIAIGKLNQNGVGNIIAVTDTTKTWRDLQNPLSIKGNESFYMIPGFIKLSVKMIFDPPPPSSVDYLTRSIDEILWRLKIAYEEPSPTLVIIDLD